MTSPDDARMLLELACEDLKVLGVMMDPNSAPDRIFGFHAQQAVEKALKAWLSVLGAEYPFTHSLTVLFGLIEDEVGPVPAQLRDLEALTPFAVQFRYVAYTDDEEELDRPALAAQVGGLLEHVGRMIPSE